MSLSETESLILDYLMSKISIDLLSNKIRISSIFLAMLFTLRLAILKPLILFKKLSGLLDYVSCFA